MKLALQPTRNKHSLSFTVRMFVRRTRTRALTALMHMLEDNPRATA